MKKPDFNRPWFTPGPFLDALREAYDEIAVLEARVVALEEAHEDDGK